MTRQEMEVEASRQRTALRAIEAKLERFQKADRIRDGSTILTINNTTIAWTGNGGITDPDLVRKVRDFIAAALEATAPAP